MIQRLATRERARIDREAIQNNGNWHTTLKLKSAYRANPYITYTYMNIYAMTKQDICLIG